MASRSRNKTKHLKYIILLLVVGALGACDKQTIYHAFRSVPQKDWKGQDALFFDVAVPDSQTYYKLTAEIRNRNTYSYQSINPSVGYEDPESERVQVGTLKAILISKEGIWKEDDWDGLYQSAFSAGSIKIGRFGSYLSKMAYALPDEILPGINDVGTKLRR